MLKQKTAPSKSEYWERAWKTDGASTTYSAHFIRDADISNKTVLEIGCGDLAFANYDVKRLNMKYIGVDIAMNALSDAKKSMQEGMFVKADSTSLPFRDNSFDTVFAVQTITCLGLDACITVKEAARVLKNGGLFVFDAVHSDIFDYHPSYKPHVEKISQQNYGTLLRDKSREENVIMTFDEKGARNLLEDSGLKMQSILVLTDYQFTYQGSLEYQRIMPRDRYSDIKSTMLIRATK